MTGPRPLCVTAFRRTACVLVSALVLGGVLPSWGQRAGGSAEEASDGNGTKWLLMICGHPGDQEHKELFADSVARIRKALTSRFGFDENNVWLWFGADEQDSGLPACRGPATRETLADEIGAFREQLGRNDELWVIVVGHAHPLRRTAQLNLPGPDITADEFGQWFAELDCRRSVFFITTPLSGYFLKPLSNEDRIVISATEADFEVNETLFHSSLADVLESFPEGDAHDVDQDGMHSLLDLYLAVAVHVARRYEQDDLLATEHAQLDDNGDGRGSELQLNFPLSADAEVPSPQRAVAIRPGRDGALARSIDLGRTTIAVEGADD